MLAGDYTLCGHRSQHQFLQGREQGTRNQPGDCARSNSWSLLFPDTNGEWTLGPLPVWLLDSAGNPA